MTKIVEAKSVSNHVPYALSGSLYTPSPLIHELLLSGYYEYSHFRGKALEVNGHLPAYLESMWCTER